MLKQMDSRNSWRVAWPHNGIRTTPAAEIPSQYTASSGVTRTTVSNDLAVCLSLSPFANQLVRCSLEVALAKVDPSEGRRFEGGGGLPQPVQR